MLSRKKVSIFVILIMSVILFVTSAMPANAQTRQHMVNPGETLAIIASYYGTSWQAIASANNIVNPNLIYAGQVLIIPPAAPVTMDYRVTYGDNLTLIAQKYGTTIETLSTLNNLTPGGYLYPGQILKVPVTVTPAPIPVPAPRPVPAGSRYYVQYGDTMFRIAGYFGVNVYDLAEVNGILNLNRIYVGQMLTIPAR